ncbi:30S ribosomal protein S9 [archaeon]|nr:MAG: 30S ribosomal protein S9 [archaeon]
MVKTKSKVIFQTGKRRLAIARAKAVAGMGMVRINSKPLDAWGTEPMRLWVKEPLMLAGDLASKVDIDVNVKSGGIVGQAEAIRMAVARALVEFSKGEQLRNLFMQYDRNMLVYDPRRNETHHGSGRGASKRGSRRHKQRSKR